MKPPRNPKPGRPPAPVIPVHCAHDRLAPVGDLKPHPKNPNRHPEQQLAMLAKIIQHQGWRAPIVISKRSGFVVSGHGRLEAAKLLGLESVPVNEQQFATEADELAHLVADNRIAELAEMDNRALQELIEDNLRGKLDLEIAGIVEELGKAELKDITEPPPPQMTWVLVGIPTVRFGEIAALVEKIAGREDTQVETTVTTE